MNIERGWQWQREEARRDRARRDRARHLAQWALDAGVVLLAGWVVLEVLRMLWPLIGQ